MTKRLVTAVFEYVFDFLFILDDMHYVERVSTALADKILPSIDWTVITKLELVDSLITLLRHQPIRVKALMVPVFDRAFQRAFNYRALFSSCVDRAIGPSVLSGFDSCPGVPLGPIDGRDAS